VHHTIYYPDVLRQDLDPAHVMPSSDWTEDSAGAAVVVTVHTAYHLGQIRHSLYTLGNCLDRD
jgi:hypothetical protein